MSIFTVGLISDTHGLLREEAVEALNESDLIIHAGDVGKFEVLENLKKIAPVYSVQGNCDKGELKDILPKNQVIEAEKIFIYVIHDMNHLDVEPGAAGLNVVITGHSHKPSITTKNNVLYINPGSAGPRRFKLPVTVGILNINGNELEPRIIELLKD